MAPVTINISSLDGVLSNTAPSTVHQDENRMCEQPSSPSSTTQPPRKRRRKLNNATSDKHPPYIDNSESSHCEFTRLVATNEPITDHRSWVMREADDSNLHTAPGNRHDESSIVARSCYETEGDTMSPHSGSFRTFSEAPPSPHFHQASGSNGLLPEDNVVKVLKNNIKILKKMMKHFEKEFETLTGYKPSDNEKEKIKDFKKCMTELSKAQKELEQINWGGTGLVSTSVFPHSVRRFQESTPGSQPTVPGEVFASTAHTLQTVEEKLKENRSVCGRRENLFGMTYDELQEKTALQKSRLYYEYVYGRPKTREERNLARTRYDHYRQCRDFVSKAESHDNRTMGYLATILEHDIMDFTLDSHLGFIPTFEVEDKNKRPCLILGGLHTLSPHELKERKRKNKQDIKRLQRTIDEFEEQFERAYGQKVQKEDRGPQEQNYLDYKHSKAKRKCIKALLSKSKKMQPVNNARKTRK